MERLTGLDAAFLYIETPSHHMHVSMVSVFDAKTVPGGYSFDKVRAVIEARLPMIPMFRRRLVEVPFNLHHPIWVDDPNFDLDYHVRRIGVPAPGGLKELCDVASEFTSRQLDRSRPLWELCIVEGLEDGKIGVLAKVHHSTIDGVSGAEVMVHLFDLEPSPAPKEAEEPAEPAVPERVPSDVELVGYAAWSLARQPFQIASKLPSAVRSLVDVVRRRRDREGPSAPAPFAAPRTSLNASITPHRKVAAVTLPFEEVKAVKRAMGCTVNDVVLALCGGALRRYLDAKGELPEEPLIAVVPISVRNDPDVETQGSNQVSALFTSLATDERDPAERLRVIGEVTRAAKDEHNAIGAKMLQDWAEFATPALFARASRLYSSMSLADRHRPIHNLIVSNVPGPLFPLYLAGAKLELLCPLGPVMEGAGLNVTVISYMDKLDIGLIACRESVPDLWDLANGFRDALEELKQAAGVQLQPPAVIPATAPSR
ncbi:MAG: WS/DGAT/MGAT family O-acyltransferase [Actinomycetota bacterium]